MSDNDSNYKSRKPGSKNAIIKPKFLSLISFMAVEMALPLVAEA